MVVCPYPNCDLNFRFGWELSLHEQTRHRGNQSVVHANVFHNYNPQVFANTSPPTQNFPPNNSSQTRQNPPNQNPPRQNPQRQNPPNQNPPRQNPPRQNPSGLNSLPQSLPPQNPSINPQPQIQAPQAALPPLNDVNDADDEFEYEPTPFDPTANEE